VVGCVFGDPSFYVLHNSAEHVAVGGVLFGAQALRFLERVRVICRILKGSGSVERMVRCCEIRQSPVTICDEQLLRFVGI
jgi:hypothetical protein